MQIRRATAADAVGAINTLRQSITELCFADHQGDPRKLEDWLGNKTVASWTKWIARTDAVVLVAERDTKIVSVGMATLQGEILSNYVHPDARLCGISKAVLAALEDELRSRNIWHCYLESTVTARSLYISCGYLPDTANAATLRKLLPHR